MLLCGEGEVTQEHTKPPIIGTRHADRKLADPCAVEDETVTNPELKCKLGASHWVLLCSVH